MFFFPFQHCNFYFRAARLFSNVVYSLWTFLPLFFSSTFHSLRALYHFPFSPADANFSARFPLAPQLFYFCSPSPFCLILMDETRYAHSVCPSPPSFSLFLHTIPPFLFVDKVIGMAGWMKGCQERSGVVHV
ncbi:hypothetical protein HOY80DRAFT_528466 [Tuber brumale]|nr:hypothetical protein HOY80DRAFT_528466 [Tuber brumale]